MSRLCFLRQIRPLVPPFPPVGTVAAPCGSPAVPHLHRYYGFVRLLVHLSRSPPVSLGGRYLPMVRRRWRALLGSWEIPLKACPELGTPAIPAGPRNIGPPGAAFRLVNDVGLATSRFSELNLHGLLPCCVRFAPTSRPMNGNTRFRPVCSTVTGRDLHPLDSIKKFHRLIFGSSSSRLFPAR